MFASEFNGANPSIQTIWSSLFKVAIFLYVSSEISGGSIHYTTNTDFSPKMPDFSPNCFGDLKFRV
jgi:hypothetical protein